MLRVLAHRVRDSVRNCAVAKAGSDTTNSAQALHQERIRTARIVGGDY